MEDELQPQFLLKGLTFQSFTVMSGVWDWS